MILDEEYSFIACPYCGHPKKIMTMISGNFCWYSRWSDGVNIFPMLLSYPTVLKCKGCCAFYWFEERIEIEDREFTEFGRKLSKIADKLTTLSVEEYYEAINNKVFCFNAEIEKKLRILAWRRWNDNFRGNANKIQVEFPDRTEQWIGNEFLFDCSDRTKQWTDNLNVLNNLLNDNDETECLMKGEICRNLGRFQEAKGILMKLNNPKYQNIISQLIRFCDMRVTEVRAI
ncbi:MAG: hypothetical protein V1779_08010 [bacterium]